MRAGTGSREVRRAPLRVRPYRCEDGDMAKKVIRPLRSEADYEAAVDEIESHFDRRPKPGSAEADRFDLLALIVDDYEREHWPIDPPDPVDAIRFGMEARGLSQ